MLVSLREISKYVDIQGLTAEEIANRLTFSGIEVEEIKHLSSATNLIIGKVLSCVNHPDSDHLHLTKVDIGKEVLDIVCGAPNVREGLKVIVAQVGAKLPGGEIKKGQIRGYESCGMLCALNELGVDSKFLKENQVKGIEELPDDAEVGNEKVLEYLGLDDTILDLSLLANRSDCYSLYNVALEIGALFDRKVSIPKEEEKGTFVSKFTVGSETPKCDSFYGKEIDGITISESPKWLQDVLRSENIRSINNIVDIGNYVMLLTGQPIHMYDLDKLAGKDLTVKDNFDCEVVALDDKAYKIINGDLIVSSGNVPSCIAGVMGLKNVEVNENTKNILIEAAHFDHASIRHTSTRLSLVSDSSQRFVKEINPHQSELVVNLVARLVREIAGYEKESKTIVFDEIKHEKKKIECSYEYINNRLGTDFSKEVIANTLKLLHFEIEEKENGKFIATVPFHRIDVGDKADLSEEIIRYIGFDQVKNELPFMETTVGGLCVDEKKERAIEEDLLGKGFDEILTYVLINDKDNDAFNYFNKADGYTIMNPLTEDRKHVRKNLLTSLLRCLEYNVNHNNKDVKLFEISPVQTQKVDEIHLAVGFAGNSYLNGKISPRPFDYFDVKGIFDNILEMFAINENRVKLERLENTTEFHPTRSAIAYLDGKVLAVFGDLHPLVKGNYSLNKTNCAVLEMNLSLLFRTRSSNNKFSEISRFPAVVRDYAFVAKDELKFADLKKEIKKGSVLIKNVEIFDIYKGANIQEGYKSLAIKVSIGASDHTLKESEINEVDAKITEIISLKLGGEIRK